MKKLNGKKVSATINKALEMLKCTFEDMFDVIENNAKYEVWKDVDGGKHKAVNMDIRCKFKDKEFQMYNYIFKEVDFNDATDIYFRILRCYILPILAGFNTYEDYELSKLPEDQQNEIKSKIAEQEKMYRNFYTNN